MHFFLELLCNYVKADAQFQDVPSQYQRLDQGWADCPSRSKLGPFLVFALF